MAEHYSVKIDQLPQEQFEASDDADAVRKVEAIVLTRSNLAILRDDEPVVIKRPDGSVLVRDGTLGGFRGTTPGDGDPRAG